MSDTPMRHCDECQHFLSEKNWVSCPLHQPRFYGPQHPADQNWGYQRRCEDFTPRPAQRCGICGEPASATHLCGGTVTMPPSNCPRCASLERELAEARAQFVSVENERRDLWKALAAARAEVEAAFRAGCRLGRGCEGTPKTIHRQVAAAWARYQQEREGKT